MQGHSRWPRGLWPLFGRPYQHQVNFERRCETDDQLLGGVVGEAQVDNRKVGMPGSPLLESLMLCRTCPAHASFLLHAACGH